jgi:hypothetical protein
MRQASTFASGMCTGTASARTRLAALAASVALTLAMAPGCGSEDDSGGGSGDGSARSEEAQIKRIFDDWQARFIAGDGDAVCSRLTASAQQEIIAAKQSAPGAGPDASCPEVVRALVKESNDAGLEQNPSRAVSVRIDGDTATAMVSDGGRKPQPVKFVKVDGVWKLPTAGFGSQ